MKFSSSILLTTLTVFVSSAQAAQVDCLDEMRYNLESMCRSECSKLDSVAFAVSYAEDDDSCRCFPKMAEGAELYNGSGDRESRLTCYSMADTKTKVLDYGDCILETSGSAPESTTTLVLKRCPRQEEEPKKEEKDNCLDAKRYNLESVCRSECEKHDSVAFSVSYAEDDDSCRCYPKTTGSADATAYKGTGDRGESRLTCYSMVGKTRVLDYGDCAIDGVVGEYVEKYTMKRCPASGDRIRRRVLA
mmetsp:Transcript_15162/g.37160  ORF Transcript_15162/g.37160 Transcript_15162/m.37160 type:complete len:247 (-) Transcript_15162:298-1038(-)|eukprot:CAMPEP_0113643550 /NCGR_PEP_ID=MMETSP0017_2-20120614/22903_1 /TAXON_ID=2856 /ORGANISM="Cylindrotheca closterium" /LENGTH=246 /DNA_ID=CAMNT_0000555079 /DNA_START=57 /DNA_END=797 /DNA_ORIENTATION=+ /assembly_acc=CAM_ASM_000147